MSSFTSLKNIFVYVCFLSAGTHSRAGRDGVGGFLHCAVCGTGLHWRPVDERLFLFHASPLAPHLPLYFQWQQHSWHWYELLIQTPIFCLLMLERLIISCHSYKSQRRNISLKVSTVKAVIHFQMTCSVFSSSPANRLQLSLSLSHSFSNGKTRPVDFSLHASKMQ